MSDVVWDDEEQSADVAWDDEPQQPAAAPEPERGFVASATDTLSRAGHLLDRAKRRAADVMSFGLSEKLAPDQTWAPRDDLDGAADFVGSAAGAMAPTGAASWALRGVKGVKGIMAANAVGAAAREGLHIDERGAEERVKDAALHALTEGGMGGVAGWVGKKFLGGAGKAVAKDNDITEGLAREAWGQHLSRQGEIGKQAQEAVGGAYNLMDENRLFESFLNKSPGWQQLPGGRQLAALEQQHPGVIRSMLERRAGNAKEKVLDLINNPKQPLDPNAAFQGLVSGHQTAADAAVKSRAGNLAGAAIWRGVAGGGAFGPVGAMAGVGSAYFSARKLGEAIWNNPRWLDRIAKTMGATGRSVISAAERGPAMVGAAIALLRQKDPAAVQQVMELEHEPGTIVPPD